MNAYNSLLGLWSDSSMPSVCFLGREDADEKHQIVSKHLDRCGILPLETFVYEEEIGIADARAILERVSIYPLVRYVVILKRGANLAASNALLKCIEECENVTFVFLCDDVIPTIRSRCVCIEQGPVSLEVFQGHFPDDAEALYYASKGYLGVAKKLNRDDVVSVYQAINSDTLGKYLTDKGYFVEKKKLPEELLNIIVNSILAHVWLKWPVKAAAMLERYVSFGVDTLIYAFLQFNKNYGGTGR